MFYQIKASETPEIRNVTSVVTTSLLARSPATALAMARSMAAA
jgi:hypothetical protein